MHKLLIRASRLTLSIFFSPARASGCDRNSAERTSGRPSHTWRPVSLRQGSEVGHTPAPETPFQVRVCTPSPLRTVRPVRVLRLREGAAERLAIVGRMADVCAELDRLVAREAHCLKS